MLSAQVSTLLYHTVSTLQDDTLSDAQVVIRNQCFALPTGLFLLTCLIRAQHTTWLERAEPLLAVAPSLCCLCHSHEAHTLAESSLAEFVDCDTSGAVIHQLISECIHADARLHRNVFFCWPMSSPHRCSANRRSRRGPSCGLTMTQTQHLRCTWLRLCVWEGRQCGSVC